MTGDFHGGQVKFSIYQPGWRLLFYWSSQRDHWYVSYWAGKRKLGPVTFLNHQPDWLVVPENVKIQPWRQSLPTSHRCGSTCACSSSLQLASIADCNPLAACTNSFLYSGSLLCPSMTPFQQPNKLHSMSLVRACREIKCIFEELNFKTAYVLI